MGVIRDLTIIGEEICDNYCKWPNSDEYKPRKGEDRDETMERLHDEKCSNCPIFLNF